MTKFVSHQLLFALFCQLDIVTSSEGATEIPSLVTKYVLTLVLANQRHHLFSINEVEKC